ncbi:hypothetical protein WICANDRAFT_61964 [Wickerhamomyces anomalus NRRL Y-366-8]|uniref:Uncharacterized protein n=1 Tax=Wickerhamomyces anomalus (strain ATCC 58044 / CBS 1984 / NCYC 433 / NRRL Y-366-8) TaxID=683960 RepID=A0A1E3P7L2_WICAA|nr:uncharacterized protein WICANDRAFT_61964 [Wickerhamomyces anomalus NRRL Y-366-8]ODQ61406.1 hypothetical protein WICANDRAFT_61964 [Wickerhamomyces anomalus NRRL Y-366-8]
MSLVTRYSRSKVSTGALPVLELDVARHLWSNSHGKQLDPESSFKSKLTEQNTDILTIDSNSIPNKINYRIINDGNSIVLTPLALNNNFSIELRVLKINLPDKIRSNCLTINQFINSNDETSILVDIISDAGMIITIILKLSDFVVSKSSSIDSSNYQEWCKISNPYGFDIRKPHILYSYSHDYSIVLLRDGGIIGLKKDLSNFTVEPIIFNDNSYFESLGNLFKPWAKNHKFSSEHSDLSLKTTIDAIHLDDYLITVTINKKLRVWSISRQSLILEKELTDFISSNKITTNKPYLDPNPTKLLEILKVEINGQQHTYLSIFLPFGNGVFKILEIQSNLTSFEVGDLGAKFEFEANLPDSTTIWLVADFKSIAPSAKENLELWVLWKSNTSSIIQNLKIDKDASFQWFEVAKSSIELQKFTDSETWSEFYLRKIFDAGLYSNEIVETALSIYEQHFTNDQLNKDGDENLLDDLSIREKVVKTIGKDIVIDKNYDENLKKQWQRFDTLCKEFQKQSDEPLKLYINVDTSLILVINRNDYSLVRKTSNMELLSNNKHLKISSIEEFDDIKEHLRFLDIISNFRKSISSDVLNNVRNALVRLVNTTQPTRPKNESLALIYESSLNNKFNPTNLSSLVEELATFDNIFKIIKDLLNLQSGSNDDSLIKGKLTKFGVSLVLKTLKDILVVNQEILFDLLILLLVLEFDNAEELESLLSVILPLYQTYQAIETTFYINFNTTTNKLELDETSVLENSLVTKILELKFPDGFLLTGNTLNQFINHQIIPFINSVEFIYSVAAYLISNDYTFLLYNHYLQYYGDTPVFALLKAVTYLQTDQASKAEKILLKNSEQIIKYRLTSQEKEIFKSIEDYSVFFHTSLSKFYMNLSILFLNSFKFQSALKFINLSISNNFNNEFDNKYLEEKYYTLFTIAIELSNFEIATIALDNIKDPKKKIESFDRFIYKLYKIGEIRRLNYYDFKQDYPLVDSILLSKAQSYTSDLKKSLFFYQVLYSFRLKYKRYRSALESLYEFINKTKQEEDETLKLTVAGLYSTILNLLVTLPKDEQWIITAINTEENDVLSYEQLKEEQLKITNSFSRDLKLKYLS